MKLHRSTENRITKGKKRWKCTASWNFPNKSYFLKTFNSESQDIEVWFTNQNSQQLTIVIE